jgi:sigma-B regulation protein RsbU (phosphoserine phosphatase)
MEPGQPLGILFQPLLDEGSVKLEAGCTLLLYTDGVTDIQDPRGGSFGENRLLNIGGIQPGKSAQDICDHILDVLTRFQSNAAQADDITIVAINKY